MARVSETNQQNHRRNGIPGTGRLPRIAVLIRRNGTWREVAFERRAFPPMSPAAATSAPQER
jgi:hypothetical protein